MDWGLDNRLGRIILPADGRTVMLAVDHGYFLGPIHSLENPAETIAPLLPYADALMLTRGVLRQCVPPSSAVPIVLRVSGGSTIVGENLANETITTGVRDAVRLNASAVALSVFVGTAYEQQTLGNLARLIDDANEFGLPVLAVTAVGKELERRDARYLGLCCRVAAELGAHFVKTYYTDDFDKVTGGCPVPVVIAGGPKLDSDLQALELAHRALDEGAVGVDMGRNVWQSAHPVPMMRALRAVVHEGATPAQAHELLRDLRRAKGGTPA
ncbi:MAG TPA: 3-hydroxy-5-phosphonooxypentane-2,4-dione thiolase [Gemmatimonadales bacterium]